MAPAVGSSFLPGVLFILLSLASFVRRWGTSVPCRRDGGRLAHRLSLVQITVYLLPQRLGPLAWYTTRCSGGGWRAAAPAGRFPIAMASPWGFRAGVCRTPRLAGRRAGHRRLAPSTNSAQPHRTSSRRTFAPSYAPTRVYAWVTAPARPLQIIKRLVQLEGLADGRAYSTTSATAQARRTCPQLPTCATTDVGRHLVDGCYQSVEPTGRRRLPTCRAPFCQQPIATSPRRPSRHPHGVSTGPS